MPPTLSGVAIQVVITDANSNTSSHAWEYNYATFTPFIESLNMAGLTTGICSVTVSLRMKAVETNTDALLRRVSLWTSSA